MKARVLPKLNHWESSWIGRISIAILNQNRGFSWIPEAFMRLHMKSGPMHTWVQIFRFLHYLKRKQEKKNQKRKTIYAKQKRHNEQIQAAKEAKADDPMAHS